jgi:hypothetical protein
MFCEAHDPSITANKPTMTQQAVACISTLSERKTTLAPKTGIRLSRYYFTIVYNSSSAVRPTKQPAPINSIYRASDTFSEAAHARRGAADCGELRQTAGAHGKPLNCGGTIRRLICLIQTMSWRSPEFYSNRVMLGFALISIVIGLMAVAVRF